MTMTINDEDQDFIKESIGLQLYLVQKKMEHLKLVEQSLEEKEQKMDNEEEIDWTQMMNLLHVTNLEKGLVEQYKNASNLDIRIGLHQKYSQNPQPWFEWIYEQLSLKEKDEVLELGCGTGLVQIWHIILDQVFQWNEHILVLSDFRIRECIGSQESVW